MKYCPKCKQNKELTEFNKHKSRPDGLQAYCIKCSTAKHADYIDKNRDNHNIQRRKHRNKNIEHEKGLQRERRKSLSARFVHLRYKAGKRNIKFELKFEDIQNLPFVCYYTGMPLTLEANKLNTVSFDRRDNTRHYVKDNVVLCCKYVNEMKMNKSTAELLEYCQKIIDNKANLVLDTIQ